MFKFTSRMIAVFVATSVSTIALAHDQKPDNKPTVFTDRVHTFGDTKLKLVNPKARKGNKGQNSAAFVVIKNTGDSPQSIVKADSPIANTIELHTSIEEDGVHKMRPVQAIEAPAHGQVELKSGGFHIMLIDLKENIAVGQHIPVTLTLDNGSTVEATYQVTGCCGSCHGKGKK